MLAELLDQYLTTEAWAAKEDATRMARRAKALEARAMAKLERIRSFGGEVIPQRHPV